MNASTRTSVYMPLVKECIAWRPAYYTDVDIHTTISGHTQIEHWVCRHALVWLYTGYRPQICRIS
jgi:hypothetical protein